MNAIFGGNAGGAAETAGAGSAPAGSAAPAKTIPASIESLIQQANQHYEKAQQDLRQGDWSGYGQEIQKLGEILKQMPAKH